MGHLPQTRKWFESTRKLRYKSEGNVYIIMLRDRIIILEILSHFFSVFVLQTLWIWSYMKLLVHNNLDIISRHQNACRRLPFPGFAQSAKQKRTPIASSELFIFDMISFTLTAILVDNVLILYGEITCWWVFWLSLLEIQNCTDFSPVNFPWDPPLIVKVSTPHANKRNTNKNFHTRFVLLLLLSLLFNSFRLVKYLMWNFFKGYRVETESEMISIFMRAPLLGLAKSMYYMHAGFKFTLGQQNID